MSADEWNRAGIREMLLMAAGRIGPRQLRLFNIWCCNVLRPYLTDRRSIAAAQFAERHVDDAGQHRAEQNLMIAAARAAVEDVTTWSKLALSAQERCRRRVFVHAAHVAQHAVGNDLPNGGVLLSVKLTAYAFGWANDDFAPASADADRLCQAHLRLQEHVFRDIVGNPFESIDCAPVWRSSDVLGLARGIADERAFTRMPILADALMDAGCDDELMLNHCRAAGPHTRGCWLIDTLLGRK